MTDELEVEIDERAEAVSKSDENGETAGVSGGDELAVETDMAGGAKSTGVGSTDSNDSGLAGDHSSPEHHERAGRSANRRRRPNPTLKMPAYPGFGGWIHNQPTLNENGCYNNYDKFQQLSAGETGMECEYGTDSNYGSHVVYVHVNIGETLNVRVGNEIQHISGPATVRMVTSRYAGPPAPLPLHVPPGHIVQQILDEYGTLKHLVLSPQPSSPNGVAGPFHFVNMMNGYMSPDGQYVDGSNGLSPFYDGTDVYAVSPVPSNLETESHDIHDQSNRAYKDNQFQRPYKRSQYGPAGLGENHARVIPPRIGGRRRRNMPRGMPPRGQTADRYDSANTRFPAKSAHLDTGSCPRGPPVRYQRPSAVDRPVDANSIAGSVGAVVNDDDEIGKISEMLSRIPPPRVSDVSARAAFVQWQPFDCSEASANGGSFPQIDSSEFTYEVLLYECRMDEKPTYSCRSQADLFPHTCLKDLKPATDYFVRLRASLEERDISGEPSASVSFRTKAAEPEKPETPILNQRSMSWLIVSWQKPCDNGCQLVTCHLEIMEHDSQGHTSTDSRKGFNEAYAGLANQYKIQNLKPATMYQIRVAASNACGKSNYSGILQTTTLGEGPPAAPELPVLIQATSSSLTLQWVKRDCDDEFQLLMDDDDKGFRPMVTTRDVVYTVPNLSHSHEYRFCLVSFNENGQSPLSQVATFSTLPPKPPAPSKPTVQGAVSSETKVNWDMKCDVGKTKVLHFVLQCMKEALTDSNWTTIYKGPQTEFTISNLDPGCMYHIRVCCETDGGCGEWSEELEITNPAIPPGPCYPPALQGKSESTLLHLKWNPPQNNGGSEISEYELAMKTTTVSISDTRGSVSTPLASPGLPIESIVYQGPMTSYDVANGLHPGWPYAFRVRAYNTAGIGQWSDWFNCETAPLPPDCPERLRVVELKARSVQLMWDPPNACHVGPAAEYWMYRAYRRTENAPHSSAATQSDEHAQPTDQSSSNADGESSHGQKFFHKQLSAASDISDDCVFSSNSGAGQMEVVYVGPEMCFEVTSLLPATDYAFCIQAANTAGRSKMSNALFCRTLSDTPDSPVVVKIEPLSVSEILVTWEPPKDNGSVVLAYHLEISSSDSIDNINQDFQFPVSLPAESRQHLIKNLMPAATYRVRVKAINEMGPGDWSDIVEMSTLAPPPLAPRIELVSGTHNSLKLKWRIDSSLFGNELTYMLEMGNKAGSFSPLATDLTTETYKVGRLCESTTYQFRVRAVSPNGGQGEWSDIFTATTVRAPPPAVKYAPRVRNMTETVCEIEWQPAKLIPTSVYNGEKFLYCLQIRTVPISSTISNEEGHFEMVYKGTGCSYQLTGLNQGVTYKARVTTIRISECGVETEGSASPVTSFTTTSSAAAVSSCEEMGQRKRAYGRALRERLGFLFRSDGDGADDQQFSDRQWAVLILVAFSGVALFVAFILQRFIPEAVENGKSSSM